MAKKQEVIRIVKFNKQKPGDMAKRVPTVSRTKLWKFLMGSRMGNCFKINLASVVAFAPVIYILVTIVGLIGNTTSNLPFTSFIGAGYPVVIDVVERAFVTSQEIFMSWGVFLLPVALFLSTFFITGPIYAARNLIWSEGAFHFKAIFKAFKFNWLNSFIIALVTGIVAFGFANAVYYLRSAMFYSGTGFWTVIAIIAVALAALFFLIVTLFAISISITYKESVLLAYRDAVVLTVKIALQNIILAIFTMLPVALLMLLMNTTFVALMFTLFLFIGFSFMIVTWQIYAQYVFDLIDGRK